MAEREKGSSLATEAWRRLRRNRAAMGGLIIVFIVVFISVFAPLFSNADPELQLPWIGAQAPGYTHPDVISENRFEIGAAVKSGTSLEKAQAITITAWPRLEKNYSITVNKRMITGINWRTNAQDQLDLSGDGLRVEQILKDGSKGPCPSGFILKTGDSLPFGINADDDTNEITLCVRKTRARSYRIAVRRGKVSTIQQAGTFLDSLDLRDLPETVHLQDGETPGPSGIIFQKGRAAPNHALLPSKRSYALNLLLSEPVQQQQWQFSVENGLISSIHLDNLPYDNPLVVLDGPSITEVFADGQAALQYHFLGTDTVGRDLWARILYGGRISLLVGLVATLVSLIIGVIYGAISGYLGGRTDNLMMQAVDILYGIPFMFLVILLLVNFGRNIIILFVALGAVQWLTMARIVRSQVLSLKNREFIAAATLSGCNHTQVLFRHLVPNCLGPVIVYTTLTIPIVILEESFLAFIGLSVEFNSRQLDSWGALVDAGARSMSAHPWLLIWPAGIMAITLLSLNLLGDGLRDALDPKLRGRQ